MRWQWPAAGSGALNKTARAQVPLKEVTIILITPTIIWPQAKQSKGTQPHQSTENWIKDLLSMAPRIHQRKDRKKTTITEN